MHRVQVGPANNALMGTIKMVINVRNVLQHVRHALMDLPVFYVGLAILNKYCLLIPLLHRYSMVISVLHVIAIAKHVVDSLPYAHHAIMDIGYIVIGVLICIMSDIHTKLIYHIPNF